MLLNLFDVFELRSFVPHFVVYFRCIRRFNVRICSPFLLSSTFCIVQASCKFSSWCFWLEKARKKEKAIFDGFFLVKLVTVAGWVCGVSPFHLVNPNGNFCPCYCLSFISRYHVQNTLLTLLTEDILVTWTQKHTQTIKPISERGITTCAAVSCYCF